MSEHIKPCENCEYNLGINERGILCKNQYSSCKQYDDWFMNGGWKDVVEPFRKLQKGDK